MNDGWDTFAMDGRGIRCVSDEPWVTASETAECSLSFAAIGDMATATDLLRWTRAIAATTRLQHRHRVPVAGTLPSGERSAYTGAAVILAADAICGASAGSRLFVPAPSSD